MSDRELWSNSDGDIITEGALSGDLRIFEGGDIVGIVGSVGAGGGTAVMALDELNDTIDRLTDELAEVRDLIKEAIPAVDYAEHDPDNGGMYAGLTARFRAAIAGGE
jgi:hydrogenase maturation factor